MTSSTRRRLRAPQADGAALIDPPLSQISDLVSSNIAASTKWDTASGAPFSEWREAGRRDLQNLASIGSRHTLSKDATASAPQRPVVLSGHQPELFHPGVWLKNFLLHAIASRCGGAGVNLIVDNDAARSTSIRVPTGYSTTAISLDNSNAVLPWEERRVRDMDAFGDFASRVRTALDRSLSHETLVLDRLWPHVRQHIDQTLRHPITGERHVSHGTRSRLLLGDSLALARHAVEREAGLTTDEVPLSLLCGPGPSSFLTFAEHLFSRAPDFHTAYNRALADYRVANQLRSRTHPVPDLGQNGEWLEMPFWMWTESHPDRRRVYVRKRHKSWELWDGDALRVRPDAAFWNRDVWSWDDLGSKLAHKLRPRALVTTMYARLVLSDLFIHGIGGAKYDELTDEIIRRFFGIEPPKYITATATFRLPIDHPYVTAEDLRASARTLRDVRYRPEAILSHPLVRGDATIHSQLEAYAAEKREYLGRHNPRRAPEEIFAGLDRLNCAMHALLAPVQRDLQTAHAQLIDDARKSALLGSREFSFVLFSEELPARLLALCQGVA